MAGILVGSARVAITPDMSGFVGDLQAKIKTALASVNATVPIRFEVDAASIARAQAALGPLASGKSVPLRFTVDQASAAKARAAMGPLAGETVPVKFVVDPAGVATVVAADKAVAASAATAAAAQKTLNDTTTSGAAGAAAAGAAFRGMATDTGNATTAVNTANTAITRFGRGFAALRGRPNTPLFGGAFGTTPIIGSISALSLLAHGFVELAAVVIPASIALGAFGVAALPTITAIRAQLTNMQTVVQATGQALGPLTGGFTRLADAVRPQVYSLFGDGLILAARQTGVLTRLATGAGQVIQNLGTRFTLAITQGAGFSRFVDGAIKALTSFGDIVGNIGGILGNFLKAVPGYANILLSFVDSGTKVLETVSAWAVPVLKAGLAFHGAAVYIGLAGTLIARAASGGLGLVSRWAETAAKAAAGSRLLGGGAGFAAQGLARLSEGAATAAALPWGWIAIVAAGVGFLAYKFATLKDATQNWIDSTQGAIKAAPVFAGLDVIMAAQATTQVRLSAATAEYNKQLSSIIPLSARNETAALNAKTRLVEQAQAIRELSVAQQVLNAQDILVTTRVNDLGRTYGSTTTAIELATLANVKMSDLIDKNPATWAKIQLEVAAVALAYKDMGQQGGILGSDMNALTLAGSDQVTQMTKLNTAWDTWIKIVSGGQTTFIAFEQGLKAVNTASKVTGSSMTGLSVNSLALRAAWQSAFTASSQVLDALRLQASIMPDNARAAQNLTQATKDTVVQLMAQGKQSGATRSELVALAQEVNPSIRNWQDLVKWLGNTKDAGKNLDKIISTMGGSIKILSADVSALSATMQTDVTSAFAKTRLQAAGVYFDIGKLSGALNAGDAASITKWSDLTYLALRKAGDSVATATGLIEAFTHKKFTPPDIHAPKLTGFGALDTAFKTVAGWSKVAGASFTGTSTASDILQHQFQGKLVPALQGVIDKARAAGPPTKALATVVATDLAPAVDRGALKNDKLRTSIYNMATEAGYAGPNKIAPLKAWIDKSTTSADGYKTAMQKLEAQIAQLKAKNVVIGVTGQGTWSVTQAATRPGGKLSGPTGTAQGWLVSGGVPGKDSVPILAMPGETVVPKHLTPMVAPLMKAHKVPGFAQGGVVGSYAGTVPGLTKWTAAEYASTVKALEQATASATQAGIKAAIAAAVTAAKKAAASSAGGIGLGGVSNSSGYAALQSAAAKKGWTGALWQDLVNVEMREAGFQLGARNPSSGAYGMAQFINGPSEYYQYGGNPNTAAGQAVGMVNYIAQRYGSPAGAWAHEQCVPLSVQILTQRGWLTYDEVQVGDLTVGFNPETGHSEWTPVSAIHVYNDAPLVRLSCKTWEATCTPSHRWSAVHWKHTGRKGRQGRTKNEFTPENVFVETQDITTRHSLRLAAPADVSDGPAISETEAELLGWVLGDGWVIWPKSRTPGSTHWRALRGTRPSVRLGQAKPEHVKAIDRLVEGLLFSRTTRQMNKPDGSPGMPLVTWEFHRPYSAELLKRSGYDHKNPVPFVLSLTEPQREAFLRGVFGAEGTVSPQSSIRGAGSYKGSKTYPQADGPKQDAIVLAIYLSGMRPAGSSWQRTPGVGISGDNPQPGAVIRETKAFIGGESIKQEDAGRGAVWCVTTSLGTWTMRQGRHVMLTGNSAGWYDKGGWLPKGLSLASNNTGSPELVLNASQLRQLGSGSQSMAPLISRVERLISVTEANAAATGREVGKALDGTARSALGRGMHSSR